MAAAKKEKKISAADARSRCSSLIISSKSCSLSDIPAVNGPMLHSASQCREYVYACLVAYKRDAATFRQALHDAADALWLASQGAPLASARVAAELAHKVLPEGRYPEAPPHIYNPSARGGGLPPTGQRQ